MATEKKGKGRSPSKNKKRKAKRKRSLLGRVLRIFGVILAIPLVLLLVVLIYLHTGSGQRLVRDKVVERVGQRVNGTFELGEIDFALFGDIAVRNLRIHDEAGEEVIALSSLEISPDWGSLLEEHKIVNRVAVDGVSLHLVQYKDGGSNLKKLFKKTPPEPPSKEPKKKKDTRVEVKDLHIGGINVTIDKPDGTRIALKDFGLDATIDAVPTKRTARVKVPRISAAFSLDKKKDGLSVAVSELETGLDIDLVEGAGSAAITPTKAHAVISQRGAADREVDLNLDAITVQIAPGQLDATIDKLMVGALVLQSVEVSGRLSDEGLAGEQKVQVLGLRVDHEQLNKLLQKELLATDVTLETKITGPPDDLDLTTSIKTAGGAIDLAGDVDISNAKQPNFDIALTASKLDTSSLLRSEKVPPVTVERIRLGLRGAGRSKSGAEVDVGLHIADVKVKGHTIDDLHLAARFDGGVLHVDPLTVDAYGHSVIVRGSIDLARKLVDVELTLDGDVGVTLAALRKAGLKVKTQLPAGALRYHEGTIVVQVEGDLEGLLNAHVEINQLAIAGGAIFANVDAQLLRNVEAGPDDKKVELLDLDGVVELRELNLKRLLAIRGKKLDGLTGTISGKLVIDEVPKEPKVDYRLTVRAQPSDKTQLDIREPMLVATAYGHATKRDLRLKLGVEGRDGDDKDQFLGATVHAPLLIAEGYRGIAPYRPLHVELTMPERQVTDLLAYVPKHLLIDKKTGQPRKIPEGTVYAHVKVNGTGAAPKGDIDIDLHVPALGGRTQRLKLDGKIDTEKQAVTIATKLDAWLDAAKSKAIDGNIRARLSRSPLLPGPKALDWSLDLDVLPQQLQQLPLPPEKLSGLSGTATAAIHLRGNKTDLGGTIGVEVDDLVARGKGPLDVALGVKLEPQTTGLDVSVASRDATIVKIDGNIARPGQGLLAALRDKTPGKSTADKLGNPELDVTLELPRQPMTAYAVFTPTLGKLLGSLGGTIKVGGRMKMPVASGEIAWKDYKTLNGGPGLTAVSIDASPQRIGAAIELGHREAGTDAPVAIHVGVPREALKPYLAAKKCYAKPKSDDASEEAAKPCEHSTMPLTARIAADDVDVKDLIPEFAIKNKTVQFDGRLSWALDGKVILDPKPRYSADGTKLPAVSPDSQLSGALALHDGLVTIPGTTRQYKEVQLKVGYSLDGVNIETISARESDLEKPNRKIDITGKLELSELRPKTVNAHVSARDWLLFGSGKIGPADAPRGSLSADVKVSGDLSGPIKKIDVTIPHLAVSIPNRFRRAHAPEHVGFGDVIYHECHKDEKPGDCRARIGKLPVSHKPLEKSAEDPFAKKTVKQGPQTGLDVHISIPSKAHLGLGGMKYPMNLQPVGSIDLKKRGSERNLTGKLNMVGGDIALGGRKHTLRKGHFIFNEECPTGCMDLLFERRARNTTLRDLSEDSGGKVVTIRVHGPISAPKATLGGAGSPGTLWDLLSGHNAGRQRYASQPDMPVSATTEFPQHFNLLLLSYLAVNVPHMLFLDRVAAWSDPYDERGSHGYGRVRHYEAEGNNEDGDFRLRALMRPAGAGQSEAELDFDWMITNTSRTAFGLGLSVGSRGGGGPGVFFEWSSKD